MIFRKLQVPRRNAILRIVVISSLLGVIYPAFTDGIDDPRAMLNGFLIGFIGSLIIAIFEYVVFNPHSRKLSFIKILILKISLYFLAFISTILCVKVFIDSLFYDMKFSEYLSSDLFKHFLFEEDFLIILAYSFFFLVIVIFTIQITRKLGYHTFLNSISGKYHKPKEESRIFMNIDIKSSTTIAEKLGDVKYHEFLNQFYMDIAKCILGAKGEIFRYVGDGIGITWMKEKGLENSNCIQAYLNINDEIYLKGDRYLKDFGFVPEYKCFVHAGTVITSEIGDIKRQILYNGDALYKLAEMEKYGKKYPHSLLISSELKHELELPVNYQYDKCTMDIDNKPQTDCYTITEILQ
jgi:adenylate cyclase